MRYDHYQSGSLYGIRYVFREGERLWPHAHEGETADQAHNVIVLKGSVRFEGASFNILVAGDVFDFDGSQAHAIVALEPGTTTLHLMLHGAPASFADYTEDQRHGEA